jgi:hypothetical protein
MNAGLIELRPLSPDASLYKPDVPITSKDARSMLLKPEFESLLSNQITALDKVAISIA